MEIQKLDHVALWVAERDRIAASLTGRFGMHVIDRTDAFTLVGCDARRGKLTLFAADGTRERGALRHVSLRVSPHADTAVPNGGLELPDGLVLRVVAAPTEEYFYI